MKLIKESILSSTNTGIEAPFRAWWSTTKHPEIPIKVIPHAKGLAILMDDLETSPYQSMFEFDQRLYDTMPKKLTAILYIDRSRYQGKEEDNIRPCIIKANKINNPDFSMFDWEDLPTAKLDRHVTLFMCNGKLLGFPKYKRNINVDFSFCFFNEVSFNAPNVNIMGSSSDPICIDKFENCTFDYIYLSSIDLCDPLRINSITNPETKPYHLEGRHILLNEYAQTVMDKFYNGKNKYNAVYYVGMKNADYGFLKTNRGKIILNKEYHWEIIKS